VVAGWAADRPAAGAPAAPGRAPHGWPADGGLPAARPARTGPLTSREREIADLVATGLTNQEIASRLFLSRRTVESHVARIFTKLDVRSRVSMANLINRSG
jgi:DNA-binding CsgD family transcriptional regulator